MNTSRLEPCIELPLSTDILSETVAKAKDYTLMHGVSMHSKSQFDRDQVTIVPFVLLPSSFPKAEFDKAIKIQSLFNVLIHRVAHDDEFLSENLNDACSDEFTAKLFAIYKTVITEGRAQPLSLGLLRSDYMLHVAAETKIIQVELNTIASSFGGLANRVSDYHRYILNELGHSDKIKNIPENSTSTELARGLADAWSMYGDEKAVILFVVEDITYNICDQRSLEFEVRRLNPKIKIIRRSFKNLTAEGTRLGPNQELIVGQNAVAVAYYRTGYQEEAYAGPDDWSMRLLIERSRAIKCPSIQYQLAGTKKIQQVLTQPRVLDRFLDEEDAQSIRQVFTGLYSLEFNEDGEKAVAMAIANPNGFVLKPQREGGGHNIYGEKIASVLESMKNSVDRTGWILMDRINPPVQKNYIIRSGEEPVLVDTTTELGIYGIVIGILFSTTQPAHVITVVAVLCVTSALVPSSEKKQIAGHPHSHAAALIYLASFVMHFGAQIWMTFVSGLSLYFALPRHTFGEVQRVLFPRYFAINACLSLTTLLIFVKHHPANTWDTEIAIQVIAMSSAFFLELLIRLYLTPPLLALNYQKTMIERAAGVGNEIGRHVPGSLKHCPHYLQIHSAFRRTHVAIAMGNILTMACTVLHLQYIASKLCVL